MRAALTAMLTIELADAQSLDELVALQTTAEAIFGRGERRPEWFARKLAREGVEPGLSVIARSGRDIAGYALLGRSASLGAVARGAGVGVVEAARGRGIGRALIDRASGRARALGCEAVEFLSEPERLSWYLAQGFACTEQHQTLLGFGFGLGPRGRALEPGATDPEFAPAEVAWSWLPEAWQRTPADERLRIDLRDQAGRGRAWLSREGRAWLVHRLELDATAAGDLGRACELLVGLRRRVGPATPILLYPCAADSPLTRALASAGFEPAQRSFVVRRSALRSAP